MARIIISYPEETLFIHELTVRVTDLNIGNHLAHDSVVSLIHEARAQFFMANDMSELDVEGYGIIMADLGVNYKAEAFFGEMLAVEIALGDFSSKGCDMYYRMSSKETGTVVAIAKSGLVFFDYEAKKPVAVPQSFLNIANKRSI
ncbi:MAG: thioesterase family protein [Alphaproteobacteria bacterium]|nr:thioesterase family protein [Alphaproteobacteria bacterium]